MVWAICEVAGAKRLDRGDRRARVDDAEVADGGDPGRDVVAGDDLLRRDRRASTVRRSTRTIRSTIGISSDEARALDREQAAEPEDDRALVLAQDPDAGERRGEHCDDEDR